MGFLPYKTGYVVKLLDEDGKLLQAIASNDGVLTPWQHRQRIHRAE
jgi:hypothetical protein